MTRKVKLDYRGFKAYRQSRQVKDILDDLATSKAKQATDMAAVKGAEYQAARATDTDRGSIALVSTGSESVASVKAMVDNQRNNTLLKAMGG